MITIRFDAEGRVTMVSRIDPPREGDLSVVELPPEPSPAPPYAPELFVRDGRPVWEMVLHGAAPDPNAPPAPDLTPKPTTPPDALRRAAYQRQADQHLIASLGYEAEGKTAQAAQERAAYLAAKARIREAHPSPPQPAAEKGTR